MAHKIILFLLLININQIFAAPNFGQYLSVINGTEALPPAVSTLLYEEQILHNKDLWGPNAFASDIAPEYIPEARPKFPLTYFLIPDEKANFLKSAGHDMAINRQITTTIDGVVYHKLFVHPESYSHYEFLEGVFEYVGPEKTEFMASPTSSYRSLVTWNKNGVEKPFIAKVSLNRNVIGGIDRLVSINEVQRSIANQEAFESIGKRKLRDLGLDFFPESAGLTIKEGISGAPAKLGGQLIRELPAEIISGEKRWISFSALMSPNKADRPLVMDIIQSSNISTTAFIHQVLINAYMEMFKQVSLIRGINFEPHSQNLCFEVDRNLKLTGKFVIRDFGGVWPDMVTMLANNGPVKAYQKAENATRYKFKGGHSNAIASYAFFYKRQVFDMLTQVIAFNDPGFSAAQLFSAKQNIDTLMGRFVTDYLVPGHNYAPTMNNRNTLINQRNIQTKLPHIDGAIELSSSASMLEWFQAKKKAGELVELNRLNIDKYVVTEHGIIAITAGRNVVKFAIFNEIEARNYPGIAEEIIKFLEEGRSTTFMSRCIRGLRNIL